MFAGCSPSERLISRMGGQTRSKTPNADMERKSRHVFTGHQSETIRDVLSPSPSLQPVMLRDPRLGAEPDDGENQRRIGRSLSGTVVTSRRSRLTTTRSFELSGSAGSFWLCLTGVKLSSDQSPALLH
ncbi:hypothetical protein CCH79_00003158 [Gambusia affinis]|uniref:Uncharacterized protein n=1 Tax=Gambusia affinis TaxID=33528 RepID=A0A315VFQ9_GAMAF|nr:hypothetical protein CCH79_00003158 [Gambusia affinis]